MNGNAPSGAPAKDYERISRAISYLAQNASSQPDLATVARRVNLSEYHFQRLFLRWAGVSPKRFLQHLTLEDAKARIAQSENLLDVVSGTGLSGPGRLHDLFIRIEAMTPGEHKAGGAGLEIGYGFYDSPFGRALIAYTPRGICALRFAEGTVERDARNLLRREWKAAHISPDPKTARELGTRIFDPFLGPPGKPLALLVRGTNFQLQVWRALLEMPSGALTTYGAIASRIGHPRAARAVGAAVGANPIAYLIPCHRVIRESGHLGGYRWGATRKAAILGWEAVRTSAPGT